MALDQAILAVVFGALLAILYLMRILVLLERRIARMDENLIRITDKIVHEEKMIESRLSVLSKKKPVVKPSKTRIRRKR